MLGCWEVFAGELHAALMCAFELDELADGNDQADTIRAVAKRHRSASQLIDVAAARVNPVEGWPAFYNVLWAARHQLGGRLDVAAARAVSAAAVGPRQGRSGRLGPAVSGGRLAEPHHLPPGHASDRTPAARWTTGPACTTNCEAPSTRSGG
jgi:hypothetical protein